MTTYRAAYLTDGDGETVLTGLRGGGCREGPGKDAGLSDDDLMAEALAELRRGAVEIGDSRIEIGEWEDWR